MPEANHSTLIFDSIGSALEKHYTDAVPLPDAEQTTFPSALAWQHKIYSIDKGRTYSGAWIA